MQAAERHMCQRDVSTVTTWFGRNVKDENLVRSGQVAYAKAGETSGPMGAVNKDHVSNVTRKLTGHVQPRAGGSTSAAEENV